MRSGADPTGGAGALQGLTGRQAAERLQKYGPNTVREERPNPLLVFLGKFWAPVPWMLEVTIAFQLVLGKTAEAVIIAVVTDKTGTITKNQMALASLRALAPYQEDEVLRFAALASDDATQDPIDIAIRSAAQARALLSGSWHRLRFVPFDSQTKRSEAWFQQDGQTLRVVKGAPQPIAALASGAPDVSAEVESLAAGGCRVLAVAAGTESALHLAGLIALADAPRAGPAGGDAGVFDVG